MSVSTLDLLIFVDSLGDRSVDEVLYFCPCETWCHLCELLSNHSLVLCYFVQVQLEDVSSSVYVRSRDMNFFVKSAWPSRSRVECLFVVSGTDNYDVGVLVEPVHLSQQLVDGRPAAAVLAVAFPSRS